MKADQVLCRNMITLLNDKHSVLKELSKFNFVKYMTFHITGYVCLKIKGKPLDIITFVFFLYLMLITQLSLTVKTPC